MVYRPTYHQDEKVYEIVSSDEDSPRPATPPATFAPADTDEFVELRLESPYLRGDRVRILQTALEGIGFNVGRIDGVFGQGTDTAVRDFQEWYSLPVTGVVDIDTANAIAAEYTAILAPPPGPADADTPPSDSAPAPDRADGSSPDAEGGNTSVPQTDDSPAPNDNSGNTGEPEKD